MEGICFLAGNMIIEQAATSQATEGKKAQLKSCFEKMIERGKLTLSADMVDFAGLGPNRG